MNADQFVELKTTEIPAQYVLYQNFPNPFNPATSIRFGLPKATHVKLEVYNIQGQRMAIALDDFLDSGYHVINFEAINFASGIYLYKIETGEFVEVKKMLLIK